MDSSCASPCQSNQRPDTNGEGVIASVDNLEISWCLSAAPGQWHQRRWERAIASGREGWSRVDEDRRRGNVLRNMVAIVHAIDAGGWGWGEGGQGVACTVVVSDRLHVV